MKTLSLIVLALILPRLIIAQAPAAATMLTPGQQKIAWAEAGVKAHPDRSQPYNDLAVAYVSRVRETADTSYFDQASAAVRESLDITPDNLEGHKAQLMILLGQGEYARALDLGRTFNKKTPDDVLLYGFVADAAMALGEYPEAEQAVQWMLDIRPGNVPALLRGAVLRRAYGDADGAMLFFSQAYQQIPPNQTENLAWILTQMADLQLSIGHLDDSESLVRSALQKFPGYYLAQESGARIQTARQRYSEAVVLLRQRNQNFPTLASRYALSEALERAGRTAEANFEYQQFEDSARQMINSPGNANRELILYYLSHGHNSAEALRIARIEIARRHDVGTLDAYAWALHCSGKDAEAQEQMAKILAVGVRDAAIFYHAGAIAGTLKDNAAAARLLKTSVELSPSSEVADAAREALDNLVWAPAETRR